MYIFFFFLIWVLVEFPLSKPVQLTGKNRFFKGFLKLAYLLYYETKFKSSCFERDFSTFFKIFNFFLVFCKFPCFPFYFQAILPFQPYFFIPADKEKGLEGMNELPLPRKRRWDYNPPYLPPLQREVARSDGGISIPLTRSRSSSPFARGTRMAWSFSLCEKWSCNLRLQWSLPIGKLWLLLIMAFTFCGTQKTSLSPCENFTYAINFTALKAQLHLSECTKLSTNTYAKTPYCVQPQVGYLIFLYIGPYAWHAR